jgi:hypothetical protein
LLGVAAAVSVGGAQLHGTVTVFAPWPEKVILAWVGHTASGTVILILTGLPADTRPFDGLKVVPVRPPDTDQLTLGSPGEPMDTVALQLQP